MLLMYLIVLSFIHYSVSSVNGTYSVAQCLIQGWQTVYIVWIKIIEKVEINDEFCFSVFLYLLNSDTGDCRRNNNV